MHRLFRRFRVAVKCLSIVLILQLFGTGCASFRGKHLEDLGQLTPPDNVLTDGVDFHLRWTVNGKKPMGASQQALAKETDHAHSIFLESGMFASVNIVTNATPNSNGRYHITYHMNDKANLVWAAVSGFITGYSLFLIPGGGNDNYTLNASLWGPSGEELWTGSYFNRMTFVMWLPLLPFLLSPKFRPLSASRSNFDNMYRHPLKDMAAKEALWAQPSLPAPAPLEKEPQVPPSEP